MKDRLDKVEAHLQRIIEGNADRLFGSKGIYPQLAHRLVTALEGNLQTNAEGLVSAPSTFALLVNSKFSANDHAGTSLVNLVAETLGEVALENGIVFASEPTISIYSDGVIPAGEFEIHVLQRVEVDEFPDGTEGILIDKNSKEISLASKPFFISDDNKIINLENSLINIGRELDNHLVLDDMRISRKHAQLRVSNGQFLLSDLNSSGGTFVNGEAITQVLLKAGDVISFAGVSMVYGEDAVVHPDETEEYNSSSNSLSDSPANSLGTAA
ncbi:MAG: FHA domain-containing protein [Chloroflexota bacterium]